MSKLELEIMVEEFQKKIGKTFSDLASAQKNWMGIRIIFIKQNN